MRICTFASLERKIELIPLRHHALFSPLQWYRFLSELKTYNWCECAGPWSGTKTEILSSGRISYSNIRITIRAACQTRVCLPMCGKCDSAGAVMNGVKRTHSLAHTFEITAEACFAPPAILVPTPWWKNPLWELGKTQANPLLEKIQMHAFYPMLLTLIFMKPHLHGRLVKSEILVEKLNMV